jgi:hypothetical protein
MLHEDSDPPRKPTDPAQEELQGERKLANAAVDEGARKVSDRDEGEKNRAFSRDSLRGRKEIQ